MTPQEIALKIDHTLLKPEVGEKEIVKLCAEARENQFFAVCVNSRFVPLCVHELAGSSVAVASVIGFPLGAMLTSAKAFEAEACVKAGAAEIDMVLAIGALRDGRHKEVQEDIRAVVQAAGSAKVKVILETVFLSREEKIRACELSREAGAAFVKTCTGFAGGGATVEDILLMKSIVGNHCEVKASGGIRDLITAEALLKAGATRLGTSSGVAILRGLSTQGAY